MGFEKKITRKWLFHHQLVNVHDVVSDLVIQVRVIFPYSPGIWNVHIPDATFIKPGRTVGKPNRVQQIFQSFTNCDLTPVSAAWVCQCQAHSVVATCASRNLRDYRNCQVFQTGSGF